MEYLKQFKSHISNNDLPAIVSLWEEYCLSDEVEPEEVQLILDSIKLCPLGDPFGTYVDQIIPLWENLSKSPLYHEIFKLIIDIQTTNSPKLAEKTSLYLQEQFGADGEFPNKMRLVGLREKEAFQGAVSNFYLLNHLNPHNFVFHTGGWGVGEIMDISFIREEISLEFDYVAGKKDLSFKNGFNTLIPISNDHFLARRFGDPDKLEKDAKENPLSIVHLLLKDLGPKSAAEIKDELCDLVIPEEEWTKWWQSARSKLKKDTLIENPKNLKAPFVLRKTEISHEERLQKILEKKPDVDTLIEIIYSFLRDFPAALKKAEFKSTLILQLSEICSHKEVSPSQELQIQFFLQDLNNENDDSTVMELIKNCTDFQSLITNIGVVAFKKRALVFVKKQREDWSQIFLDLFLTPIQNATRDYIFQQLIKSGKSDELKGKLNEMLEHPHKAHTPFLWYFSKVIDNNDVPFGDHEGRSRFLETFFVLMYLLERGKKEKDFVKKMHNFLTADRYSVVRKIFQHAPIELVQEVLLLSTKCQMLDEHDNKILQSLAQVVHPSLGELSEKKKKEEEEVVLWTTEEGYLKIKERLHQIATVETVQNAKEIEVARSHGDLRENAEFKYALEKREQLQNELTLLSGQMSHMRIITIDDINAAEVGVGTVVQLENENGQSTTYTFLGPWDTDVENNILSFNSKIAQSLAGAKINDERKMQNAKWIIRGIKSYLEQK